MATKQLEERDFTPTPALLGDLFLKYDVPTPRYTSYPTVPHWRGITQSAWDRALSLRAPRNISLYVHVPYCPSPCTFCGCTKVITKDKSLAKPYIRSVLREAKSKFRLLSQFKISELHAGGGSPTWLGAEDTHELFDSLIRMTPGALPPSSFSVEVDPRNLTPAHVDAYRRLGVNRVSLGVQDFNEQTLKAIHRAQPEESVRRAVDELRQAGIMALNFDLVYGLPYQNIETMRRTAEKVVDIRPSRIALYSYAHLPSLKPAQHAVGRHGLPDGLDKWRLSQRAREVFADAGYEEVGFDHFALPEDPLAQAARAGTLHRNFMGYVDTRSDCLLGLGPSSLSDCHTAFAQNPKEVSDWMAAVDNPPESMTNGHALDADDLRRRELILDVMCRLRARLPEDMWEDPELRQRLESLRLDGILDVKHTERSLSITTRGRPFLRNVSALLDSYFLKTDSKRPIHSRN